MSGLTSCVPISHWTFDLLLFPIIKRATIHMQDIYEKISAHVGSSLTVITAGAYDLHWRVPVQIPKLMKSPSRCAQHEGNKAVTNRRVQLAPSLVSGQR